MFEIIYRNIIEKNLEEVLNNLLEAAFQQDNEIKKHITDLVMSLLLYHLEVDGLKIKKDGNSFEFGNFIKDEDFIGINSWTVLSKKDKKLNRSTSKLKITLHKYCFKKDKVNLTESLKKLNSLENFLIKLIENKNKLCNDLSPSKTSVAKDVLLGYVFHLDDFVSEAMKNDKRDGKDFLSKLGQDYGDDQRFRLFEDVFSNIKKKAEKEIERHNLREKINVQFAFGYQNGGGSYFFFQETFKKFQRSDDLKIMITNPNKIVEKGIGLLSNINQPKRYGAQWAIFTDDIFPNYLKYLTTNKELWKIEKSVFFTKRLRSHPYFMGAIPFFTFEEMCSFLYLEGIIGSDEDLNSVRKAIGFLNCYLFSITEDTKNILGIMSKESEKTTLRKRYISDDLLGDKLLNLVDRKDNNHEKYVQNLLHSYPLK